MQTNRRLLLCLSGPVLSACSLVTATNGLSGSGASGRVDALDGSSETVNSSPDTLATPVDAAPPPTNAPDVWLFDTADANDAADANDTTDANDASVDFFGPPEIVAEGQFDVVDIATDGARVYWLSGSAGAIRSHGPLVDGGVGVTEHVTALNAPSRLLVDNSKLYWVDTCSQFQSLKRRPKTGGSVEVLRDCNAKLVDVAHDVSGLALIGKVSNAAFVGRLEKAAPVEISVAAGLPALTSVAISPAFVYWASLSPATIDRAPRSTVVGESEPFVTGQSAVSLAADATHLYWAETSGAVRRLSHTSPLGPPEDIALELTPTSMHIDARYAYWIDATGGAVRAWAKDGSGPAITVSAATGPALSVAASARGVYWTAPSEGRIYFARRGN